MKLTQQERAVIRESFAAMTLPQKAEYVFAYYKPLLLAVAVGLIVLCSVTHRFFTYREPLLYVAYANVSVGDTLDAALGDGFVRAVGENPRKREVYLYRGLYLSQDASTENHEYAYASQLKVLATIANERFDVALMNREAYDLLSGNGYLLPLEAFLAQDDALPSLLAPYLTENDVILSDNAIEYNLNETDTYEAVTESVVNGVAVSALPLFERAGFSGDVYLGVIGNSPRLDMALRYIAYLAAQAQTDPF